MGVFDKITHITHLQHNNTEEEVRNLIKESTNIILPRPNDDVEFIVPLFDAHKHYKHLKKMMWKHSVRK